MTWWSAAVRSLVIFGYFVVFTVWLPDFVLQLGAVSSASRTVQDLLALTFWGVPLVGGVWALRNLQRRGLI